MLPRLYLYICLALSFSLPISRLQQKDSFKKVSNRTHGTTVIRIQVHADSTAIIALKSSMVTEFSTDLNSLTTLMKFFGGIFDLINEDIQNLGIQVRGDFSKLVMDQMPYDKTKCIEGDPVMARTNIAKSVFTASGGPNLGNKLLLLFCPERVMMPPKSALMGGVGCSNIAGVMFGELRALKEVVTDTVYKIISYGNSRPINQTANFERNAQKYVSECIGNDSNINGEFVRDLKAVRHLSSEKFILKNGSKLKEHDLMDDVYLLKSRTRKAGYPTEDYSNDNELYSDFNE